MSPKLEFLLTMLRLFFGNDPTMQEVETLLPEVVAAIKSARAGEAFSVLFPLSIDGVKEMATFSVAPIGSPT